MESEIQGLEDRTGYFVQQDKVVAIRFHPSPRRGRASGLVERIIPPVERRPLDPEANEQIPSRKPDSSGRSEKEAVQVEMDFNVFSA
jgi:hypothetical protein